jgi:hypothetical protein
LSKVSHPTRTKYLLSVRRMLICHCIETIFSSDRFHQSC